MAHVTISDDLLRRNPGISPGLLEVAARLQQALGPLGIGQGAQYRLAPPLGGEVVRQHNAIRTASQAGELSFRAHARPGIDPG